MKVTNISGKITAFASLLAKDPQKLADLFGYLGNGLQIISGNTTQPNRLFAMARTIEECAQAEEAGQKLGQQAAADSRATLTPERIAKGFEDLNWLYQKITGNPQLTDAVQKENGQQL